MQPATARTEEGVGIETQTLGDSRCHGDVHRVIGDVIDDVDASRDLLHGFERDGGRMNAAGQEEIALDAREVLIVTALDHRLHFILQGQVARVHQQEQRHVRIAVHFDVPGVSLSVTAEKGAEIHFHELPKRGESRQHDIQRHSYHGAEGKQLDAVGGKRRHRARTQNAVVHRGGPLPVISLKRFWMDVASCPISLWHGYRRCMHGHEKQL